MAEHNDWEAEEAARVLIRAEEIRNTPELLLKVQAHMKAQAAALEKALDKHSEHKQSGVDIRQARRHTSY